MNVRHAKCRSTALQQQQKQEEMAATTTTTIAIQDIESFGCYCWLFVFQIVVGPFVFITIYLQALM